VRDERKRAIRGLWSRNGRYYAQLALEDLETGRKRVRRVPLEEAATVAQAKARLEELKVARKKGALTVLKQAPDFEAFAAEYLRYYEQVPGAKKASTLRTESHAIDRWTEHVGHMRLDQIRRIHVDSFIRARQSQGVAARTVNLEVTVLRNVLNKAVDAKWIHRLPTENLRPLKSKPPKRQLVTSADIEALCRAALEPRVWPDSAGGAAPGHPLANGRQLADYIKLMAYCGARMSEALRLKWADADWGNRQLTIGADGDVKNHRWRVVDFNSALETHLKDMFSRRAPDSDWLFPSPRRGEQDRPARTFRSSLTLARRAAGLPRFGFHDCRHHFISMCVMSGVDYLTIARWVGHQDGGVLIGRVYGHLSDEHRKRSAAKVSFNSDASEGK
jgi:integrase